MCWFIYDGSRDVTCKLAPAITSTTLPSTNKQKPPSYPLPSLDCHSWHDYTTRKLLIFPSHAAFTWRGIWGAEPSRHPVTRCCSCLPTNPELLFAPHHKIRQPHTLHNETWSQSFLDSFFYVPQSHHLHVVITWCPTSQLSAHARRPTHHKALSLCTPVPCITQSEQLPQQHAVATTYRYNTTTTTILVPHTPPSNQPPPSSLKCHIQSLTSS